MFPQSFLKAKLFCVLWIRLWPLPAASNKLLSGLPQSLLTSEELPLVYEQPAWSVEGLGPFLRLCLLDQHFPAFVEEVERELKKLTGLGN